MQDEQVFDLEGAMSRVDNDRELYAELYSIFTEELPLSIGKIKAAIEGKQGDALQYASHSIKSALGNLGAMTAHNVAFKLEMKGRAKDLSGVAEELTQLEKEIALFQVEAEKLLAS